MHEASFVKKFLSCVRKFQTCLWYCDSTMRSFLLCGLGILSRT